MPAVGAQGLFQQLAKGKAPSAVLLLGADPYWRQLCRRKLIAALVPGGTGDWAVTRASAEEIDVAELVSRAQMRPMLVPRQIIFVGDTQAWEQGSDDTLKKNLATLTGYFEDPAPFTVLVFEAEKLDQRTRLARLLAERTLVVELDATRTDPVPLAVQMAQELGVQMEPEAAAALAEATAGRAARMASEVEKLACYVGERKRITARDVGELVVAEGSAQVWELAGLLAAGQRGRALELIEEMLRKGETAPRLVGALAWMFRKLLEASELPVATSSWQAARRLGMRPDPAETAIRHAHRMTPSQLRDALSALAEADDRLKSKAADDRGIMEFLLARLSRPDSSQMQIQKRTDLLKPSY